ncbi:UDP-N-acetylmuramoyl-L-alanine--D-glutamate ligase [Neptunomonas antarctica]|uniref:UDP-N-acetylmuramoylalanine--D-glutamate ligase n=1 Tax=Neptunomonas antarctica TaxID=619304 RepID=A0A1N7PG20_9GAMM|nr:UDP-N-acetylmuramoyl-L-alanine--D-glutamate ligase [Neptunomonas antarctica]SIT09477.1 UDP-N-acetylmuramoylalanine--D-glutamate ligase [Neptunomonas antarctica]
MSLITSDQLKVVIGLGQTGLSCARYLAKKGLRFALVDTRDNPPNLDEIKTEFVGIDIRLGELDAVYLMQASELILSPGVSQQLPAIKAAVAGGVALIGDIDLFCREVSAPIVAITGSNAKSTVTTLVGEMAKTAGIDVGVGGNLGTPVLDMLTAGEQSLYVLELSSFQLETVHDLRAQVATVLNISPDHLDRYEGMQGYYQAKHRVFRGCRSAVENRDDALTHPLLPKGVELVGYRLSKPDLKVFGLIDEAESGSDVAVEWLAIGNQKLMRSCDIKMPGRHNVANALAALALGRAVNIPMDAMLDTLKIFGGLEHRCQWVAKKNDLTFYNDSKGTNVGATVAALDGLGAGLVAGQRIVLIAGGDGKGADFDDLIVPVNRYVRAVVLIGQDAGKIRATLSDNQGAVKAEGMAKTSANIRLENTLESAVQRAVNVALPGDIILLSPACASFDMFKGYADRGHQFVAAVSAL